MAGASSEYLAVAERIADDVAREAIWHDGRCSWLGAMPDETPDGRMTMTQIAFGADLYGGTAGVGLFLAELYGLTGAAELRRTAIGALRHAHGRAAEIPAAVAHGLYAGRTGVALALARASKLLRIDEFHAHAATTMSEAMADDGVSEFDLISGAAGGIVGALVLTRALDDGALVDHARRLGDALVSRADVDAAGGASWSTAAIATSANLTGLSHGAAGAGLALLELAAATGEQRYAEVGRQAFSYERGVYDTASKNWPDFRQGARQRLMSQPSCATFWCHGAPGIALSRIRAHALGDDDVVAAEARTALSTTGSWVSAALESGLVNYSLCHGLTGNADALLEGRDLAGEDAVQLVGRVADAGIERYARPRAPWPCGTHEGTTPSLLLGLAGIGYFYLRLAAPSVPSILLPRADHYA